MTEKFKSLFIQVGLAVFGVLALVLAYSKNPTYLAASPVVGLMGQPFWLYFGLKTKAWGMVFLVGVYTLAYVYGVINAFWPSAVQELLIFLEI